MPKQPVISERARRVNPSPTLSLTAKINAMKADGADIVGFTAGEPDFDTPAHVKQAAVDALNEGFTKYTPTGGIPALKAAVCEKLKRDNGLTYEPKQVLVSVGGKHSLFNAFLALLDPGDEVIIPAPYWVTYPEQVTFAEGKPVIVQTTEADGFKLKASAVEAAITPRTKALVLNSPSNPTGAVYEPEELRAIARLAVENDFWILSDEMYEQLTYGETAESIASYGADVYARTLTMNGCSKAYSMTGWRIGYTAGPAEVIEAMTRIQDQSTSNPTSIAQRAAVAALAGPQEVVAEMRSAFHERRDVLVSGLNALPGVRCPMPGGAFYAFPDFSGWLTDEIPGSDALAAVLLEKYGVGVIPGSGFGADTCVRLSYATSMKNIEEGLARLRKAAGDLAKKAEIADAERPAAFVKALEGLDAPEALVRQALTHRSWEPADEPNNERLEFLGDAVLELLVSEQYYRALPEASEGTLTRRRARTVSEPTLTAAAEQMGLGAALRLARGEEQTGGRTRPSILSDAYEALTAAVYLGGGLDAAREFVRRTLGPLMESLSERDFKSIFQEWAQEERKVTPTYRIVEEAGPEHSKEFRALVLLGEESVGEGRGRTKKEAEQNAALNALGAFGIAADN